MAVVSWLSLLGWPLVLAVSNKLAWLSAWLAGYLQLSLLSCQYHSSVSTMRLQQCIRRNRNDIS